MRAKPARRFPVGWGDFSFSFIVRYVRCPVSSLAGRLGLSLLF
jgi:hypothetical protein